MPVKLGNINLYSTNELSSSLKVTLLTLRKYLKEGKIKGKKVGGKWFVTEESLRDFFEEGTKEGENSISLQGITTDSTVTEKDIKDIKNIWK